ncbi:hypothetical protein TROPICALSUN_91 [Erwinia phage vB_EamM_TropicalSun]|uniref:Uncharacterized protein n=2 Tax=Myosmarvirus myosmar TaxID=2846183 RepID=A0A5B9NNY6_9CAUD|nr:hypothetical protein HWC56_gp003 [Serratia phage MyoSmar]QEG09452.1 hypothetical protein CPT_MyoSmar_003 [Serratia phage MyoSmar]QEG13880.1 hypothetical protein TROPICALSUN_91 [Erwinia phage vB_EamM_TropicalSun]
MQFTVETINAAKFADAGCYVTFESALASYIGLKITRELSEEEFDVISGEFFDDDERDTSSDGSLEIDGVEYNFAIDLGRKCLIIFYAEYVKDENGNDTDEVDLFGAKGFDIEEI